MKANGAIYVAGHRGLVGGAICRALQEQGYTNPTTGTHGELDLTEQLQVRQFFTAKRPAYVVPQRRGNSGKYHLSGRIYP